MILFFFSSSFFSTFRSDRYVSSVAQHQNSNVSCGLWNWNHGEKDITALKSHIAVEYLSVPALVFAHSHPTSKSKVSRDSTWEEVDMCAGSVGLIKLQC